MTQDHAHHKQLEAILPSLQLHPALQLRCWMEADFPAIERLSTHQGWPTPHDRPEEALRTWQHSWPALVVTMGEQIIGFVRGITDGEITLYIAEILVDPDYRGQGIGRHLLDACHAIYPHTRLDLIATEEAIAFYRAIGFHYVGEGWRKSYRFPSLSQQVT